MNTERVSGLGSMCKSFKLNCLSSLALVAMLAVASSANSAIQTKCEGLSSIWSSPQSNNSGSRTGATDAPPLPAPRETAGINSLDFESGSAHGGMSGQNTTQNHTTTTFALISPPFKLLALPCAAATLEPLPELASWSGDEMLDPPKTVSLNSRFFDEFYLIPLQLI